MTITMVIVAVLMTLVHGAKTVRVASETSARERSDGALFREVSGQGKNVVLLPGFLGTTRYFTPEAEQLSANHRVIRIDTLGFGRSPWPKAAAVYTLEDHLDALHVTLREEGAAPMTLVGHSMGAVLALAYAARYPDDVEALLLLGTPIFDSPADARQQIRGLSPLAGLFALNATVASAACHVVCAFRPAWQSFAARANPERRPEVAEDAFLHTWPSFKGTLQHVLIDHRIVNDLNKVSAKTTLIHARNDEVTPIARARSLARETEATLIEIDGDHHAYRARAVQWLEANHAPVPAATSAEDAMAR